MCLVRNLASYFGEFIYDELQLYFYFKLVMLMTYLFLRNKRSVHFLYFYVISSSCMQPVAF